MEYGDDLESEAAASAAISESGSTGSDRSLREAIITAQQVAQGGAGGAAGAGGGTGAGGAAGAGGGTGAGGGAANAEPRVAGVLSLVDAQTAASDGAVRGIAALERYLRPSASRFACLGKRFDYDIRRAEAAAAAGAAAGVKAVALMVARNQPGPAADEGLDPDLVLAAARMGARAGALAVRLHVAPAVQPARYTAFFAPLLGGSLPASAAVYHLVSSSNDLVKRIVFTGMALGVFAVSSGLMVGLLGSSPRSAAYCQVATVGAFAILWGLLTFGVCSFFV